MAEHHNFESSRRFRSCRKSSSQNTVDVGNPSLTSYTKAVGVMQW